MDFPYLTDLADYINARWAIRLRRQQVAEGPWTLDPLLAQYRFCNVHREDDRATQWIKKHWRDPYEWHPHLWHRLLLARMINWPPSLQYLGFQATWDADEHFRALDVYRMNGNKLFTGAYIISTNGKKMDKLEYVISVLDKAQRDWYNTTPVMTTLADTHEALMGIEGVGSFLAAQVVADLKHTKQLSPAIAGDWWDWAAPGPGSQRGLSRVTGLPLEMKWHQDRFVDTLMNLRTELEPYIEWVPDLCLQDLQNNLCEFDKYQRLKAGGKVRATYKPHTYPV